MTDVSDQRRLDIYYKAETTLNHGLRTLPPPGFLYGDCTRNHSIKVQFLRGQFLTKSLVFLPRGNFSNYFMKVIVFSQLYRSKLATLKIAYDMKNRFLVMYSLISPAQTIRTYIRIKSDLTVNESVSTEINCSQ